MIKVCEDCEYTVLIADLIETLAELEHFILKVWVTGSELPYIAFSKRADFEFLQEGLKVYSKGEIDYLFYDTISLIKVEL